MPEQKHIYENLRDDQKIKLFNIALDLLAYKPSLIGDVKDYSEYLVRIEEFAKTLYEKFPNFQREGGTTVVKFNI
jgi:hypothetical protein